MDDPGQCGQEARARRLWHQVERDCRRAHRLAVGAVDLESSSDQLLHQSTPGGSPGAGDEDAAMFDRELQTLSRLTRVRLLL